MDFSGFSSPKVANKRKAESAALGQLFNDLKYRRNVSKDGSKSAGNFTVSNARFESLNLENLGLRYFIDKNGKKAAIGVVAEDDAQVLKSNAKQKDGKGRKFKADTLEAALHEFGLIDSTLANKNQAIKMTEAGKDVTVDGYKCAVFFLLEKDTMLTKEQVAKDVDAKEAPKAEAPKAEGQPQAEAAKVWD